MIRRLFVALLLALLAATVHAHESRPAYLQLRQVDAESYDVLWKVPALGEDRRLSLDVEFAPGTARVGRVRSSFVNDAFLQEWRVRRAGGIEGSAIRIAGLEATLTDALVRLERSDGSLQTMRVGPSSPTFVIAARSGRWDVTKTYLILGVEHILLGIDHLLFVLALVLLVDGRRRLVWTITAFTAAHSLTLAAATLGWVYVPGPPVEASIALSIVFLASEILHARAGRAGLTTRAPWIVAFVFGLLHGLGFAGALSDVGLPQHAIPTALLFFNVGVEIGQLLFIAAVMVVMATLRRLPALARPRWTTFAPAYAIGGVAAYWTLERIAGMPT